MSPSPDNNGPRRSGLHVRLHIEQHVLICRFYYQQRRHDTSIIRSQQLTRLHHALVVLPEIHLLLQDEGGFGRIVEHRVSVRSGGAGDV